MLRRLHSDQPETFAFTPANEKWAKKQLKKYPAGRQASAIIPLLWRAQEQEGWLSRPAIEHVSAMLDMPYIRGLEVATFYFMFQLQPVGAVAHVQVCGTTSCMICGAEDLIAVCREKIASRPHEISGDGKFSWEEVECLGACTNAPMVQIGKDFYEDLTTESFGDILDAFARGEVPTPGPQNGRFAAEPKSGLSSLKDFVMPAIEANGSVARALAVGDTIKRIDGREKDFANPVLKGGKKVPSTAPKAAPAARKSAANPAASKSVAKSAPKTTSKAAAKPKPSATTVASTGATNAGTKPKGLSAPKGGKADDLKLIKGVGPKLEKLCNKLGFYHFAQIAKWNAKEIAWVDDNLEGFKGRVTRDDWVAQARVLSSGKQTEFSKKQGGG